jgi:hypothetical protein
MCEPKLLHELFALCSLSRSRSTNDESDLGVAKDFLDVNLLSSSFSLHSQFVDSLSIALAILSN